MKRSLSKVYKELGIDFVFPIAIKDPKGNETYYENSKGTWYRREHDEKGNRTYYENSDGRKEVTPRASCNNKVITIDGKKYKLTEV